MLKTVYIPFEGDLYEITGNFTGDIIHAQVYRDGIHTHPVPESLTEDDLPEHVVVSFHKKIRNWWKDL